MRPPAGLDEGPSYHRGRLTPPSRPLPWPPLVTSWEEQSVYVSSDAPDPPWGAQETAQENSNATRNLAATRAPAPSSMASSPTVPHTLARDRGPAGQHRAGRELGVRTGRLAARAADLRQRTAQALQTAGFLSPAVAPLPGPCALHHPSFPAARAGQSEQVCAPGST